MRILFRGEVGDNQSWGISTIGNVKGFLSLGHQVTIDPMNSYGNIPDDVKACINKHYPTYDVFIRQGLAKHMQELQTIDKSVVRISLSCWDSSLVDAETVDRDGKMFITFVSKTDSKPIGSGNSDVPNKFVDNSAGQAFGLACNLALRYMLKKHKEELSKDGWWDLYSSYVGLFYNKNKELKEKLLTP